MGADTMTERKTTTVTLEIPFSKFKVGDVVRQTGETYFRENGGEIDDEDRKNLHLLQHVIGVCTHGTWRLTSRPFGAHLASHHPMTASRSPEPYVDISEIEYVYVYQEGSRDAKGGLIRPG